MALLAKLTALCSQSSFRASLGLEYLQTACKGYFPLLWGPPTSLQRSQPMNTAEPLS